MGARSRICCLDRCGWMQQLRSSSPTGSAWARSSHWGATTLTTTMFTSRKHAVTNFVYTLICWSYSIRIVYPFLFQGLHHSVLHQLLHQHVCRLRHLLHCRLHVLYHQETCAGVGGIRCRCNTEQEHRSIIRKKKLLTLLRHMVKEILFPSFQYFR